MEGGGSAQDLLKIHDAYRSHSALWEGIAGIYVACFCENEDLLSQWRTYSARGQGFCLGFDPRLLIAAVSGAPDLKDSTKLLRAVYKTEKQREWVDHAIDALLSVAATTPTDEFLNQVLLLFYEMSLSFKHPALSEEQEWRLALNASAQAASRIDIRASAGRLLPYAVIPISDVKDEPLYVHVVHGPAADLRRTQNALKILIGKKHPKMIDRIRISGSEAPFQS